MLRCGEPRRRRRRRKNNNDVDKLVWASRKNIVVTGVPDRGRRYLSDFYTTLIDIQWRWNLLVFTVGFVITWLAFAVYYFLLCFLHGDLDPRNRADNATWIPCVVNVNTFTEAYLFSIETMSTIGYGSRYGTEACPGVYMAVMLQSVIGAGLQFALASLVVSKTRRANRRSQTIVFSDTAVVYQEDGELKLAVRLGDMRKGDVIGAHATGMLIRKTVGKEGQRVPVRFKCLCTNQCSTGMLIRKTVGKEGQRVPVRMFTVPLEAETGRQQLFLCWPSLLVHRVDQTSPFWPLSRDHLLNHMYELIVILDGVAASTSKPFQARKSYYSWEILWGRRFVPLQIDDDHVNSHGYVVNYDKFHDTFPVSIPLCSAQTLERARKLMLLQQQQGDNLSFQDDGEEEEEIKYSEGPQDPSRPAASPSGDFLSRGKSVDTPSLQLPSPSVSVASSVVMTPEDREDELHSNGEEAAQAEADDEDEMESAKFWATRRRQGTSNNHAHAVHTARRASIIAQAAELDTIATACLSSGSIPGTPNSNPGSPKRRMSRGGGGGLGGGGGGEWARRPSRVEFQALPPGAGGPSQPARRMSREDAVNLYRHRRSVTDTYLGTELPEEEDSAEDGEASAAILSLVALHAAHHGRGPGNSSQVSSAEGGKHEGARDAFKHGRKSVTLELMFGTEGR